MSKEDEDELSSILREAVSERAAKVLPDDVREPVTLDPRPAPAGGRDMPPDPSPSGPLVNLDRPGMVNVGGFGATHGMDINSQATRDAMALDKGEQALRGFAGSMAGGGIAGGLASRLPGVAGLVKGGTLARAAGGALTGAAGGAGATVGDSLLRSGGLPSGKDTAIGAGMGGVLGAGIGAASGKVAGAPAADESLMLRDARGSGMAKPDYARFFGSREGAVKTLRADRELRSALGKPAETLSIIEKRFPEANGEATKVMDSADATNGRLPVTEVRKAIGSVFQDLEKTGGTADNNPAAAAAYRLAKQFSSGIGSDPAHPPSTSEIRKFLTEEVGSKLNTNPSVEDSAVNRASSLVYGRLKDLIQSHVEKASPELGAKLSTLNERQATYSMLRDAAAKRMPDVAAGVDGAKPGGLTDKMAKLLPYARGAAGAEAGRMLAEHSGGLISPAVGAAGGAVVGVAAPAVGSAARAVGNSATRALATPTGQKLGKVVIDKIAPHAADVLVPKIVGALQSKDEKGARAAAAEAVYGGP